jgi:hypothetical protein
MKILKEFKRLKVNAAIVSILILPTTYASNSRVDTISKDIVMVEGTAYSKYSYAESGSPSPTPTPPNNGYYANTGMYYSNGVAIFKVINPHGTYTGSVGGSGLWFPDMSTLYTVPGWGDGTKCTFSNGILLGADGKPFTGLLDGPWTDGSDSSDQWYAFINGQLANGVDYNGTGPFGDKFYKNFLPYTPASPTAYDPTVGLYFVSNGLTTLPSSGTGYDSNSKQYYVNGSQYSSPLMQSSSTGYDSNLGLYFINGNATPGLTSSGTGRYGTNTYYNGQKLTTANSAYNLSGTPTTLNYSGTGYDFVSQHSYVNGVQSDPFYMNYSWGYGPGGNYYIANGSGGYTKMAAAAGWLGTGYYNGVYYLSGSAQPGVDSSGTGRAASGTYLISGYTTTLDPTGSGYWAGSYGTGGSGYYINGTLMTGLNSSGNGISGGRRYVNGVAQ